jgi:MYXO-CTERM domain-containing protein
MRSAAACFGILATVLFASRAQAADFYVDPASGASANDGSSASPWSTLQQVIADGKFGSTIHGGDTVWLRSGYHGEIVLHGGTYSPAITLRAADAAKPQARRVAFEQTQGWVFSGIDISPSYGPAGAKVDYLVSVDGNSSDIEVSSCIAQSVADASGWTADDWINTASSGVDVSGSQVTLRSCVVRNVRFGIVVDGDGALIDSNLVDSFSADGLRGLGNQDTFQYNVVKNIYVGDADGDTNHDDGFQSWSVGTDGVGTGEVVDMVLRGNLFISTADPNHPFATTMQGIGCFDGYFTNWVVENNVVITDHWHGISMYGMRGGRVVNNTVIDLNTDDPGPPWIMVTAHKDGTPSENVLVRNNLATDYDVSGTNVTQDHNATVAMADLATYFVDPSTFDLHLLANAPAVNAGSSDQAPATDRDGIPRPQGSTVDQGAYEWHDPSVTPIDAGSGVPEASTQDSSTTTKDASTTAPDAAATDASVSEAGVAAGTADDDGGCSCRVARRTGGPGLGVGVLLLLGLVARRRRWGHATRLR